MQATNKAYRLTNTNEKENSFFVKDEKALKKVDITAILFLEAMQNYVKIVTEHETIITHSSLKEIKENLSKINFIQTHKSFIVAKDKIKAIEGNQLIITDYKIPISVRMKKKVLEKIMG